VNDDMFRIQVSDVDGEAHAQGMDTAAWGDPQSVPVAKVVRSFADKPSKPGPVAIGDGQSGGEELAASAVQSIAASD
jgi:hypothetical protein